MEIYTFIPVLDTYFNNALKTIQLLSLSGFKRVTWLKDTLISEEIFFQNFAVFIVEAAGK